MKDRKFVPSALTATAFVMFTLAMYILLEVIYNFCNIIFLSLFLI